MASEPASPNRRAPNSRASGTQPMAESEGQTRSDPTATQPGYALLSGQVFFCPVVSCHGVVEDARSEGPEVLLTRVAEMGRDQTGSQEQLRAACSRGGLATMTAEMGQLQLAWAPTHTRESHGRNNLEVIVPKRGRGRSVTG